MFKVFICEDDRQQLSQIEQWVKDAITFHDLPMEIILATKDPYEVIEKTESKDKNIYFFDVDLGMEMNGIKAAGKIRQDNPSAKIVFITTHDEMVPLIFKYRVEALDYIVKSDNGGMKQQVINILVDINANEVSTVKNSETPHIVLTGKVNSRVIEHQEIMFFETMNSHKVLVHLMNGQLDVVRSLKELEQELPTFVRIHKSYLINPNNIRAINKKEKEIEFKNGEKCFGQRDKVRKLSKMLKGSINI